MGSLPYSIKQLEVTVVVVWSYINNIVSIYFQFKVVVDKKLVWASFKVSGELKSFKKRSESEPAEAVQASKLHASWTLTEHVLLVSSRRRFWVRSRTFCRNYVSWLFGKSLGILLKGTGGLGEGFLESATSVTWWPRHGYGWVGGQIWNLDRHGCTL